jgi:hypothetical protein
MVPSFFTLPPSSERIHHEKAATLSPIVFFGADLVLHHIFNLTFSADITLQIFENLNFSIIFRPVIFF